MLSLVDIRCRPKADAGPAVIPADQPAPYVTAGCAAARTRKVAARARRPEVAMPRGVPLEVWTLHELS